MTSRPGVTQEFEPVEGGCCPHCGGTSGFQQTWTARFTTFFAWEGTLEDTNEPSAIRNNLFRCSDCNKVVEDVLSPVRPE